MRSLDHLADVASFRCLPSLRLKDASASVLDSSRSLPADALLVLSLLIISSSLAALLQYLSNLVSLLLNLVRLLAAQLLAFALLVALVRLASNDAAELLVALDQLVERRIVHRIVHLRAFAVFSGSSQSLLV